MTSDCMTPYGMINRIQNSNYDDFEIDLDRDKNYDTMIKYDLTPDDIVDILKTLYLSNYRLFEECEDQKYDVDYWFHFHKNVNIYNDQIGESVSFRMFIRVGILNYNNKIMVRSCHEDD